MLGHPPAFRDSENSSVILADRPTMDTATRRFQNFTAYVGAASQHALRMTFVLEAEAKSFDMEVWPTEPENERPGWCYPRNNETQQLLDSMSSGDPH